MMVPCLMIFVLHVGGTRHICWFLVQIGEKVIPWWWALGVPQLGADRACKTQQQPQHPSAC